jgi:hypothetical protein
MLTEQIVCRDEIIAVIIRAEFNREGAEFFTPNEFSQQLGYMNRAKGYKVEAHTHKKVEGKVIPTNEVLYVKSGKIKISLYNSDHTFFEERTINCGDVILLATAGHSIEMLENSEVIEIKQGPASGGNDKINFIPAKN